jgi:hypothetical protein
MKVAVKRNTRNSNDKKTNIQEEKQHKNEENSEEEKKQSIQAETMGVETKINWNKQDQK